jgi:hypothetical protein
MFEPDLRVREEIGQKFATLRNCPFNLVKRQTFRVTFIEKVSNPGMSSVYRCPLEQLPLNEDQVPAFLPECCEFICENARVVGLFRLCGQHLLLQELGGLFLFSHMAIPPCAGVHDIAAFLKRWLRELPEPLISPDVFKAFFTPENPDCVRMILKNLPVAARKSLAYICKMIEIIVDLSSVNQMTFGNLSFCFFENITQNSRNLDNGFPYVFFFKNAMLLLNENGTDFNLGTEIDKERAIPYEEGDHSSVLNIEHYRARIGQASDL